MNNDDFFLTAAEDAPAGFFRHFAFCQLVEDRQLTLDFQNKVMQFEGLPDLEMQLLGSFSTETQIFTWIWHSQPSTGEVADLARYLKDGANSKVSYEALKTPEVPATEVDPFTIGVVAASRAGDSCFWCAPSETGYFLLVVLDPPVNPNDITFQTFASTVEYAAPFYEDRKELVEVLADDLDLMIESQGNIINIYFGDEVFEIQMVSEQPAPAHGSLSEYNEALSLIEEAKQKIAAVELEQAAKLLHQALELKPRDYWGNLLLAKLEVLEGHDERAELRYLYCTEFESPGAGHAFSALAEIYRKNGDFRLARAAARRALEAWPHRFTYYALGLEMEAASQYLEAVQMTENALAHSPDGTNVKPPLEKDAELNSQLGRRKQAIWSFESLISQTPDSEYQAALDELRRFESPQEPN